MGSGLRLQAGPALSCTAVFGRVGVGDVATGDRQDKTRPADRSLPQPQDAAPCRLTGAPRRANVCSGLHRRGRGIALFRLLVDKTTEGTLGTRKRMSKKGLKHDALLETTAKGTKFIEQHLNKVLIGAAAVVVVVLVIAMVIRGQNAAELAANAQLMAASQSAGSGLIAQAAQQYEELIATYPGTRSAGAATCYMGTIRFLQQDYDGALSNFEEYLDRYGPSGNLGKIALEGKASVLEQRRDYAGAADIYRDLAQEAGDLESTVARYLADAMRCYRSANDWDAVAAIANEIINGYPGTPGEAEARLRLAEAQAFSS